MKNKLNLILLAVLTMTLLAGACKDKNTTEVSKSIDSANKNSNGTNVTDANKSADSANKNSNASGPMDANKFVDSADKKNVEAKDLFNKMPDTFIKILGELDQKKDLAESKKKNEAEVTELTKSWDKIIETYKSAGTDFREAAKLSQKQGFKDYYEARAQGMDMSAEICSSNREMLQAFLDSNDLENFDKKMDAINSKIATSKKDAVEMNEKIKKIQADLKAQN